MRTVAADKNQTSLMAKYEKYVGNDIELLLSAKKGLRPEAVFDFISISRFSPLLVEQLLNKTIKTFNNYKVNNTVLDSTTSEKLLKLFTL